VDALGLSYIADDEKIISRYSFLTWSLIPFDIGFILPPRSPILPNPILFFCRPTIATY